MTDDKETGTEPPCLTCMQNDVADKLKFRLGEEVMIKEGVKTEEGKVVPIHSGSYTVVEQTSPVKFKLRKNSNGRHIPEREVHEDRIIPIAKKNNDALNDALTNSLVSVIATNIPERGWPYFTKKFKEEPERKEFEVVKQLITALGMAVSFWAIFMTISCT